MSDWHVQKVLVGEITKHPDPETTAIEMTVVDDEPVVIKKNVFKQGDTALYLPIDTVLPNDPENKIIKHLGLKPRHCVKARRLRGQYSQGILLPIDLFPELEEYPFDVDLHEQIGVTKKIEADMLLDNGMYRGAGLSFGSQENIADPGVMKCYTDIESKAIHDFNEGEEVIATLKIHGSNIRFTYRNGEFYVGSRTNFKKRSEDNLFWKVAMKQNIEEKMKAWSAANGRDDLVLYGEVYGGVQKGFMYDTTAESGPKFRMFDTRFGYDGPYNNWDRTVEIAKELDIESVPVLYRGPLDVELLRELAEGQDPLNDSHIREGLVVKPVQERCGGRYFRRVVAKVIGKGYKLTK